MPPARLDRRRSQARAQTRPPPRLALAATNGYERAVMTLRVAIQHRPRPPRPPHHIPPPRSHFDYLSYSLNQRIDGKLHTPSTRRPDVPPKAAAPTTIAVEPEAAQDVLHVESHTWRMPPARRDRRRSQARAQTRPPPAPRAGSHRWVRAGGGGPACGHLAPAAPSAPSRSDRAATPSWRCGTPNSASRTGNCRPPYRRIPPGAPATPGCSAPPASPPPPHRPTRGTQFNYISYSFYQRTDARLRPQSLDYLMVPSVAARASLPSPSPPAVRAMQSTHARRALLAPPPLPAPSSPPGSTHLPSRPHTVAVHVARQKPPANTPRPGPRDRRSPSRRPRATNLEPRPGHLTPIIRRTHLINESREGSVPQSLGYQTTPSAAASASIPSPSPAGPTPPRSVRRVASRQPPPPRPCPPDRRPPSHGPRATNLDPHARKPRVPPRPPAATSSTFRTHLIHDPPQGSAPHHSTT